MIRGPLRRVHIGSGEYSSTRRTPRPILALVTSISKRVLAATSTRFPRVILASIEYTRYSFYTLLASGKSTRHLFYTLLGPDLTWSVRSPGAFTRRPEVSQILIASIYNVHTCLYSIYRLSCSGGYRGGGYFHLIILFSGLVSAVTEMTPPWANPFQIWNFWNIKWRMGGTLGQSWVIY